MTDVKDYLTLPETHQPGLMPGRAYQFLARWQDPFLQSKP